MLLLFRKQSILLRQGQWGNIRISGNSPDANWKESNANNALNPPNSYVVAPENADWGGIPAPGVWFPNGPNSSWIAPNPNDAHGNGNFTLTYTFNLAGYDLTTATFNDLRWSIDDAGFVQLNGHTEASLASGNWSSFNSFSIPVSHLEQTVNTLTITSTGSDGFLDGARLEGTLTISPIPEPATYAIFMAGLILVSFLSRRYRSTLVSRD